MAQQFNNLPVYPVPLTERGATSKDWYFFWTGLFRGIAPANIEVITIGASPYSYTAPRRGSVVVQGGTVSAIQFSRDGTTFITIGQTAGMFTLNASDILRVIYTVLPAMTFIPT